MSLENLSKKDEDRINSWLEQGRGISDDEKFFEKMIFYWISFNCYYGARFPHKDDNRMSEKDKIRHVFSQIPGQNNTWCKSFIENNMDHILLIDKSTTRDIYREQKCKALVRVYFHETYEEDYSDSTGYYHVTDIPICYCLKNATCSKEVYKTEWVLLGIVEDTAHDFILTSDNHPPNAPEITGKVIIHKPGPYEYKFKATDPDDDNVRYFIDWDDGNTEWTDYYASSEEITITHTWSEAHHVTLRARANDTYGALGPWGYIHWSISTEDNNEIEPLNNYVEIITKIEGWCDKVEEQGIGLIIHRNVEMWGSIHGLVIEGIRRPWDSFREDVDYVKASCFIGIIDSSYPRRVVWGIALGDVDWS